MIAHGVGVGASCQVLHLLIVVSNAQGIDPGTWGKADQATMQRRKVVRARRAGGAAEPAPTAAAATPTEGSEQAAAANPFAGVSLTAAPAPASNPFAGVSLLAAAKVGTQVQTGNCCAHSVLRLHQDVPAELLVYFRSHSKGSRSYITKQAFASDPS
jgi:hypothetical protein